MDKQSLWLLLSALCRAPGVSGEEGAAARAAMPFLQGFDCRITPLGSLLAMPAGGQAPRLLLTAHLDQIGLMALGTAPGGFVRVAAVGGVDRRALAAARVVIHTADGPLPGVVTSVPPHLQTGEAIPPKADQVFVDTGLSGQALGQRVSPGDRITFEGPLTELCGGRVCGAGLDDRAGCAAVILAAGQLAGCRPDLPVAVLLASQEETGQAGARTGAFDAAPEVALAVDVSYGWTPGEKEWTSGALGKGPMVGFAPILKKEVSQGLVQAAKEAGLGYQVEVMGGRTGTDADLVAIARGGVATGLLSIPLRYMHTPGEVVCLADVLDTARLLVTYARTRL